MVLLLLPRPGARPAAQAGRRRLDLFAAALPAVHARRPPPAGRRLLPGGDLLLPAARREDAGGEAMAMTRNGSAPSSGAPGRSSAGLVAVFIGERMIGSAVPRRASASTPPAWCVVLAMTLRRGRAFARRAGRGAPRRADGARLLGSAGCVLATSRNLTSAGALAATLERRAAAGHRPHGRVAHRPRGLAACRCPSRSVETAYARRPTTPIEEARVRDAAVLGAHRRAGGGLRSSSSAYIVSERDMKVDVSYFRTTPPGERHREDRRQTSTSRSRSCCSSPR